LPFLADILISLWEEVSQPESVCPYGLVALTRATFYLPPKNIKGENTMDTNKTLAELDTMNNEVARKQNAINTALTAPVKEYLDAIKLLAPDINLHANFYDFNEHHIVVSPKMPNDKFPDLADDFDLKVDNNSFRPAVEAAIKCRYPHTEEQKKIVKQMLYDCDTQLVRFDDEKKLTSSPHRILKRYNETEITDKYHMNRYFGKAGQEGKEVQTALFETLTKALEKTGSFMLDVADEKGNKPANWLELLQKEVSKTKLSKVNTEKPQSTINEK